jgi:hypothetical protein
MEQPEKIYGRFDATGKPTGFWTSDVYPPQEDGTRNAAIPAEAVEITFATWEALLNDPLHARYTGGQVTYVEAPPIPPPVPDGAMVEAQRANERLDAGVTASVDVVRDVQEALHNLPNNFNAQNFAALLLQMKIMLDAFVAMLAAQADIKPGKPP